MYYHFREHIYLAQFRDDIILLDLKADRYTICLKHVTNAIMRILDGSHIDLDSTSPASQESSQDLLTIQRLAEAGLVEKKEEPFPFHIDRKIESEGVSNIEWTLPLENKRVRFCMQVLRALATLVKVNFYIKLRGLHNTIQLIKRSRKNDTTYNTPTDENLKDLARIVNTACLIYPTRTKCLEWAMTYVLLALKRNWKCNLEIGVQNYPFLAHAWVECGGKTVMDSEELRSGLSIILNEPFRKMKA